MMIQGGRSKKQTGISFPRMECWSPIIGMATFAADHNGSRILCRIESGALSARDDRPSAMAALADQRAAVHAVARVLIEEQRFEEDGSILIRDHDMSAAPVDQP